MVANLKDKRNSDIYAKEDSVKWADKVNQKEKSVCKEAKDFESKRHNLNSGKTTRFAHRLLNNSRYDSDSEMSINS